MMTLEKVAAARRLITLCPRVIAELFAEIGPDAEALAREYAERLTAEMVVAAHVDSFPPSIDAVPEDCERKAS